MKSFKRALNAILKKFRKPKDYSPGSADSINMYKANNARNEESATKNSTWAPGALKRHDKLIKKLAKQQKTLERSTSLVDEMLAKGEANKEPTTRLGKAYKRLKEKKQ
jgi:hypothetical protein